MGLLNKFKSKYNNFLLNASWLDKANKYAAPFEQGSRFGIGGGGQIGKGAGAQNNLLGALGIGAGILALLPSAAIKAIQGARTADEALNIARSVRGGERLAQEIEVGAKARGIKLAGATKTAAKVATKATANPLVRGAGKAIANASRAAQQRSQSQGGGGGPSVNPDGIQEEGGLYDPFGGGGGGSGTGTAALEPNYTYLNGIRYDLNDPGSANAFYAAQRDQYIADAEGRSRSALEEANRTYGQNLGSLNQDLENLGASQAEYGEQSARQITDLGQGYDLGTVKRGQFFAGASPRAYQSSQGSSQLFALDKFHQGTADVTSALERANKAFQQQKDELGQERSNLEYGFNQYNKTQEDYLNQARRAAGDFYNTQGANAFNINTPGGYAYSRKAFNPYQAQAVDLSQYTPYTNFNQLPGATPPNSQQGGGGGGGRYDPRSGYQGLSQYLGYEPGQQERDLLDKYLKLGY